MTASRVSGSNKNSIINRVSLAAFQSSTKIEALREEIDLMLRNDPSGKAIVFSQFTSMLDLIHFRLQQVNHISYSCPYHMSFPAEIGVLKSVLAFANLPVKEALGQVVLRAANRTAFTWEECN